MSLKIWTLNELIASPIAEVNYLITPLLQPGGVLLLSGDEKCFKSYLALNIGYAAATGALVLFKYQVARPLSVLYIEAELGVALLKERATPINFDPESGGKNFKMISRDLRIQLDTEEGKLLLNKALDEAKPDILILDPIVEFHQQDENLAIELKKMLLPIRNRMVSTGMGLILIHHNNKMGKPRGSKYLEGLAQCIMKVCKNDLNSDQIIDIDFTLRSAAKPKPMRLKFNEASSSFIWINQ